VSEVVTVLIVEDDQLIQGMVEEALSDGGFKSVITGSGEEAVALLQANEPIYRAIVTDINLLGRIDGWEVARCGDRPGAPRHLYDRDPWRGLAVQGPPE
jgi:DNA-binding response OmpR family regulator